MQNRSYLLLLTLTYSYLLLLTYLSQGCVYYFSLFDFGIDYLYLVWDFTGVGVHRIFYDFVTLCYRHLIISLLSPHPHITLPTSPHYSPHIPTLLSPHPHITLPTSPHYSPHIPTLFSPHPHITLPTSPHYSPHIPTLLSPHPHITLPTSPHYSSHIPTLLSPHPHITLPTSKCGCVVISKLWLNSYTQDFELRLRILVSYLKLILAIL